MVEFDGNGSFGKVDPATVVADLLHGQKQPATAPQGVTAQTPPATSGTSGRLRNALRAALGSPILDAGQVLIAGMRMMTGWDDPERGDPLGYGATLFTRAGETVGSAYPNQDWTGAGAQAYETANRRQADRIGSMAMLDRSVQTVIAREAYQIAYHRDKLDDQSNYLGDLSYLTWPLGLASGAGKAMKAAVELSAVSAALSICSTELYQLWQETNENATQLRELAGEYSALTGERSPPDLDDVPPRPPFDEPLVPGPTGQPAPGQTAPNPAPARGPAPTTSPAALPDAPTVVEPVPVSCASRCDEPVAGAAAQPAESAPASPAPSEMTSGMTSAFSAVGGMIGAVVAPMAAALTGAAGAAGQSLSTMNSADVVGAENAGKKPEVDVAQPEVTSDEDPDPTGAGAGGTAGSGPATPDVVVEAEASQPHSKNPGEPPTSPVPPAATRPPQ